MKSPARLEMKDLPRDKQGCLGSLRKTLCASVNYCKRYPAKLSLLKETLKAAYQAVVKMEAVMLASKQKKAVEAVQKAKAEQKAKEDADKVMAEAEAWVEKEAKEALEAKSALAALKLKQDSEKGE